MEVPEMMKDRRFRSDSEYLELQLYLKSDDIMESNITETYDLDDDTYAEEEGKVYDVADDSEWKAVGEKILD